MNKLSIGDIDRSVKTVSPHKSYKSITFKHLMFTRCAYDFQENKHNNMKLNLQT